MKRRLVIGWVLLLASASWGAGARAQEPQVELSARWSLFAGDIYARLFGGFVSSHVVDATWHATPSLAVEASWGFAHADTSRYDFSPRQPDRGSQFANPWLGVRPRVSLRRGDLSFGVGVGYAVAEYDATVSPGFCGFAMGLGSCGRRSYPGDEPTLLLSIVLPGMDGGWDLWRWLPQRMSFGVTPRASLRPHPRVRMEIEGGAFAIVPTGDQQPLQFSETRVAPRAAVQLAVQSEVLLVEPLGLGARIQSSWISTQNASSQTALRAFVALHVPAVDIQFAFLLNLGGYYGGTRDLWATQVTVAVAR